MTGVPDWLPSGWPHIWLPYTQMQSASLPQPVVDAEGCAIILADGRRLIDGIASWWSACHGYKHPALINAMQKQLQNLPHVMFGGLAHEPAYTLAKRLTEIAPHGLNRVFYADSGSVAVEVALKMAVQYWRNAGKANKHKFVCFRNGYHGDTLGAMGVSDPSHGYHDAFSALLQHQYLVDIPDDEYDFAEFESLLHDHRNHIAACIIEPLVQGAGGMKFHSADTLAEIHRICKANDILFIADEIAVGFYRSGYRFACEEAGITPDILCLGKALTAGMMTLAATLTTESVYGGFLSDSADAAFMHGPTYMGNPLACSAALASLDVFATEPRAAQVEAIEQQLLRELEPCRTLPGVVDVRVKGAIGVVQIDQSRMDRLWLRNRFIELGVWLRPLQDVIYITPPFTISEAELRLLTTSVITVLQEWSQRSFGR